MTSSWFPLVLSQYLIIYVKSAESVFSAYIIVISSSSTMFLLYA